MLTLVSHSLPTRVGYRPKPCPLWVNGGILALELPEKEQGTEGEAKSVSGVGFAKGANGEDCH